MAPVRSHGLDALVGHGDQVAATLITSVVCVLAVLATLVFCRRNRVGWPLIVLISGGATFLCEPMFDHYYGLWFYTRGQWNAVVTYGIHVPIWVPIVYVPYYGAWTVFLQRRFSRGVTMADLAKLLVASVLLATLAEQLYVQVFSLYDYQTNQPFDIANYPVLVAIINGLPPFLAAIIYVRLVPLLRGWWSLAHVAVVPIAFASGSFGAAWLYLGERQSGSHPPGVMLDLTMVSAVVFGVGMVFAAAKLAGIDRRPPDTAPIAEPEPLRERRPVATGAPSL
ncbi:MAG: hypothetical protein ACYDHH_27810 [Solirubrobacteraceae bacterium]